MGIESVTRDELLAELIAVITPPPPGDGWFTTSEIYEAICSSNPNVKRERVYDNLKRGYEAGRLERITYQRMYYFRKKEA